MKPTKRRKTTIEETDDVERKKLYIDSNRNSFIHFEDLSNEIIYEIFELLDIYHVYKAFSNLNKRFDNLLTYSTLPININLSSISKSTFQYYNQHIIIPNKHRINSLRLSNVFTVDLVFSPPRSIREFSRLEILILDNIQSSYFNNLLNHLATLPNLHSLVVIPNDQIQDKNTFYRSIFHLPVLKYCKLIFESHSQCNLLLISTNESSSIEHLVIYNKSTLHEFRSVLSYVPQLRRLSWHKLSGLCGKQVEVQGITLKHLTHASIELQYTDFDQFEPVIINLFHQLEILHISTSFNRAYLDSNRWERLISSYMPQLRIFDFEHRENTFIENNLQLTCTSLNNLFTSSFWCEHHWFFTHQCFWQGNWTQAIFYSTDPYRRKHYTSYGETNKESCLCRQETSLKSVRHVHIQGEKAMMNCGNYFPDATELTLLYGFNGSINQIANILNHIIPLMQLTKLFFDCGGFCFGKVIHLIHFIPNIHTLKVYSMIFFTTNSVTIQKSETFQLVSTRNMIKNFTVENRCTLEEMKLLVSLCSRLEHVNIDVEWKDFDSIFALLLSKMNNNTHNLFSLCLKTGSRITVKKLVTLIEANKWLDDYSIELIRSKLYLWW